MAMKLIESFFSSSSSKKKKGSSKDRTMNRSDTPSFGSSASSGGSDSFTKVVARATPRTVIIGRNASGLDAEYWSASSPGPYAPKGVPGDAAPPRSVIIGRNASGLDAEYWSTSSPRRFAPKGVAADAATAVVDAAAVPPEKVSDLFGMFDLDGDGKITKQELEVVLRLGRSDPPSEEEVAMMVAEMDRDGDGCISLDEFRALETALRLSPTCGAGAGAGDHGEEELRDAFAIFDADGDGKISAEELLGIFQTLGDQSCTLDDCRRMIGGVDSNGGGFVCFDDFVRMMDGQR